MEGDKTSLINDIEDEEVVDFNLEEEDIQEEDKVEACFIDPQTGIKECA